MTSLNAVVTQRARGLRAGLFMTGADARSRFYVDLLSVRVSRLNES